MMATRNDVTADAATIPAAVRLTQDEMARLQGAGARRVVLEELDGSYTALACWMSRAAPDQFIAFRPRIPLEQMSAEQRAGFIERAVRRTAEHHETLPLTDDEQDREDAQRR